MVGVAFVVSDGYKAFQIMLGSRRAGGQRRKNTPLLPRTPAPLPW
jgi:hypothetical protein